MILLAFPMNDNQTGLAIERAFKQLGYDVITVNVDTHLGDLFKTCERHNGEFELCLTSRTMELYEEVMQIKIEYPHIKTAIWNTDVRETIEQWGNLIQFIMSVDYYFAVANGVIDRWKKLQPNTFWLPQAVQEERYFKVDNSSKKYDVGFIGNCIPDIHTERVGVIAEMLADPDIDFHWYQGVYDEDHNKAVSECRINLACSAYPKIDTCFSVRNWKIIGAGGLLLEREHPGIKKFFQGKAETYDTIKDSTKQAKKILDNYGKYQQRAEELYEWAIESQTYKHRIVQMMEIVS